MGAHVIAVTALLTFNGIFTRLVPVSVRVFVFLGFEDHDLVLHISASRHQALQLTVSPQTGNQTPPPDSSGNWRTIDHAIGY